MAIPSDSPSTAVDWNGEGICHCMVWEGNVARGRWRSQLSLLRPGIRFQLPRSHPQKQRNGERSSQKLSIYLLT
jgi:hypothetical protein